MFTPNPAEYRLIRASFDHILGKLDDDIELAQRIYRNLFELAPQARAMFATNMSTQEQKLIAMLTQVIVALENKSEFTKLTTRLASSHRQYKVLPEHYILLKAAVMRTFTELLPGEIDDATAMAWSNAYDAISEAMQPSQRTDA